MSYAAFRRGTRSITTAQAATFSSQVPIDFDAIVGTSVDIRYSRRWADNGGSHIVTMYSGGTSGTLDGTLLATWTSSGAAADFDQTTTTTKPTGVQLVKLGWEVTGAGGFSRAPSFLIGTAATPGLLFLDGNATAASYYNTGSSVADSYTISEASLPGTGGLSCTLCIYSEAFGPTISVRQGGTIGSVDGTALLSELVAASGSVSSYTFPLTRPAVGTAVLLKFCVENVPDETSLITFGSSLMIKAA